MRKIILGAIMLLSVSVNGVANISNQTEQKTTVIQQIDVPKTSRVETVIDEDGYKTEYLLVPISAKDSLKIRMSKTNAKAYQQGEPMVIQKRKSKNGRIYYAVVKKNSGSKDGATKDVDLSKLNR